MAGLAYKNIYVKLITLLLVLLGVTLVYSPVAFADNAAGPFVSKPMRDQMVDYQQLTYTLACMPTTTIENFEFPLPGDSPNENVGSGDMVFASTDQLVGKKYLDQGILGASLGRGSMYDNAAIPCDSGLDFAFVWPFENFGKKNLVDFYCSMPGVYHNLTGGKGKTISGGKDKAACVSGAKFTNGKSFFVAKKGTNLRSQAKAVFTTTKRGKVAAQALTPAKEYLQYWMTFDKVCEAKLTTEYPKDSDPAASNGAIYRIPVVNQNGKIVEYIANTGGASTDGKLVVLDATHPYPGDTTCGQLAVGMRELAEKYSEYLKGPGKNDAGATDGTGIPEIIPGEEEVDESGTSCDIDGIGWIICPVMNFLAEINDKAYGFLTDLLSIRPSLLQDEATVTAWSRFRDLANIAFVIAFLVIIYSQITSVGISNYGIKKLLPKIAIAAILVNLSLFICQILVDASNIAGSSLYSFIKDIVPPLTGTSQDVGWGTSASVLLAGGIGIVLIVFLGAAPAVLLALFLVLFILIARQAFILILVIISPLAFVAYLLPNTENMFKKWWKALSAMLLLYPIIGVVFGASTLASNILMGIASDNGTIAGEKMGEDNQLLAIVALAVMALPLFAVPLLLKGAMSSAGAIGAKLQGMADKSQGRANGKVSSGVKERYGNSAFARGRSLRKAGKNKYKDQRFAEAVNGGGGPVNSLRRRAARGLSPAIPTDASRQALSNLENAAYGAAANADNEEVGFATRRLTQAAYSNTTPYKFKDETGTERTVNGVQAHLKRELDTSLASGDSVRTRAAFDALRSTGEGGLDEARRSILHAEQEGHFYNQDGTANGLKSDLQGHIGANAGSIKPKDVRLDVWKNGGNKADQISQLQSADVGGLDDGKIATQSASSLRSSNITAAQAARVLKNPDVAGEIKQRQIAILEHIAAGGTPDTAP